MNLLSGIVNNRLALGHRNTLVLGSCKSVQYLGISSTFHNFKMVLERQNCGENEVCKFECLFDANQVFDKFTLSIGSVLKRGGAVNGL